MHWPILPCLLKRVSIVEYLEAGHLAMKFTKCPTAKQATSGNVNTFILLILLYQARLACNKPYLLAIICLMISLFRLITAPDN